MSEAHRGLPQVETQPEIVELESKINFSLLKSTIQDTAQAVGVNDQSQLNFLEPHQIKFTTEIPNTGIYDIENNAILLNKELIVEKAKKYTVDNFIALLDTIVEEELHAVSKRNFEILPQGIKHRQSGYFHSFQHTDGYVHSIFYALTEMLVYILKKDVMYRYAKQDSRVDLKQIEELYRQTSFREQDSELLVFIRIIADAKQITVEQVKHELFKGLFVGKDIVTDPLTKWVNKIYGKDAIRKIARIGISPSDLTRAPASELLNKILETLHKIPRSKQRKSSA